MNPDSPALDIINADNITQLVYGLLTQDHQTYINIWNYLFATTNNRTNKRNITPADYPIIIREFYSEIAHIPVPPKLMVPIFTPDKSHTSIYPIYWNHVQHIMDSPDDDGQDASDVDIYPVTITGNPGEYNHIMNTINRNPHHRFTPKVTRIERCENIPLWKKHIECMYAMGGTPETAVKRFIIENASSNGGGKGARSVLQEYDYVFHGTGSKDAVDNIMLDGFDIARSWTGDTCGAGIYTSPYASYSYTYGKLSGRLIMCRALVGRWGLTGPKHTQPPINADCGGFPEGTHAVFFNEAQLYPEYIIYF